MVPQGWAVMFKKWHEKQSLPAENHIALAIQPHLDSLQFFPCARYGSEKLLFQTKVGSVPLFSPTALIYERRYSTNTI
jgi:hypothetical protein